MRFIENEILERIGFDFYCGIANNIVKARAEMGWIQKKPPLTPLRYQHRFGFETMCTSPGVQHSNPKHS